METPITYIAPSKAVEMVKEEGLGEVSVTTIYAWLQQYEIGFKLGGRWRIDKEKFEKFLQGQKNERT